MVDGRRPSRQVRRAEARKNPPDRKPFRRDRLVAPLLVAAGLFAYHNSLHGVFVLDDLSVIYRNATIRTLAPPWAAFSPPARSAVTGRPLVNLSLAINYAFGGFNVISYHVFNLAIHILSALVLFGTVRRTLAAAPNVSGSSRDNASFIATAVALLWVVHPLASESVDYTIQRTELLMGLFFLLTLYCSLRGLEALETPQRRIWHVASWVAFGLGMGSKEVIIVAPAVVLAYDSLFWSTSFKDALRRRSRLYVGFGIVLVLSILLVAARFRGPLRVFGRRDVTPWEYALTESRVIVHYLQLALWPSPLVADYTGWPIARSVGSVLPFVVIVVALLALTVYALVRRRKLAFLGVWFFAILAPTSSFRPIVTEVAAERRMYLPLAAVVTLTVFAAQALFQRLRVPRAVRAAVVGGLAVTLAIVTITRNEDYRTTLSFWSDVVAKRPDNPRARIWLGNYLYSRGETTDSVLHLTEAVRLHPGDWNAHYNLATVLASQGKDDQAIKHYREAIRISPRYAGAHNNLGLLLVERREIDEAIEHYREAIRINPRHAYAHFNLALVLVDRSRPEEAIEHLEAAVRLEPRIPGARDALETLRSARQ